MCGTWKVLLRTFQPRRISQLFTIRTMTPRRTEYVCKLYNSVYTPRWGLNLTCIGGEQLSCCEGASPSDAGVSTCCALFFYRG